jgi:hypothetical protein
MNRTSFLEKTLPHNLNILNNIKYVESEILVLNYNSKDHLDNLIQNLWHENKLKYIKTLEPQ